MKLFGLIGYPLGHSFSKKYFDKKFVDEHLTENKFELFPIEKIEMVKDIFKQKKELLGLAVTIPHKQTIIPFLKKIDDAAKRIGAVNCIKIIGEETVGYNTDQFGFEKSFLPLLQPQHNKALVLGTGGSSAAVQYILNKNHLAFTLVSRIANANKNTITYNDIDEKMMNEYSIIINCTPVGMSPNEKQKPAIPYHFLTSKHILYDLIYNPQKTAFLIEGEKFNCIIKNGFEMLQIQAEENWKIWNG